MAAFDDCLNLSSNCSRNILYEGIKSCYKTLCLHCFFYFVDLCPGAVYLVVFYWAMKASLRRAQPKRVQPANIIVLKRLNPSKLTTHQETDKSICPERQKNKPERANASEVANPNGISPVTTYAAA